MNKKAIFIHSLFRTGSTYIWNKFRKNKDYCCYYEPFNQSLLDITIEEPSPWVYDSKTTDELRHPRVEKDYLFEYKKFLRPGQKGVPFFKKSFSFDDFCNNENNLHQKKYIDYLIESCGDKIPVFQFNRSALRVQWFKHNYPGAINIYLVRNPRDQFQSYVSMYEENQLDIFLAMDLLVTGLNIQSKFFKSLTARIPLFEFRSHLIEDEQFIYSRLLPLYSTVEKYDIFYFTWFYAFLENVLYSDSLLNIDFLSTSQSYRRKVEEAINTRGIDKIDFSDARIRHYKRTSLSGKQMKQIEETVQSFIIKKYTNKEIERFDKNLDPNNRAFFKLDKSELIRLKKMPSPKIDMSKEWIKKYQHLFDHFSRELVNHHHHIQKLQKEVIKKNQQLNQKNQQLLQKDQQLLQKEAYVQKILNSKSFRLGRFMLAPILFLVRIVKKDK